MRDGGFTAHIMVTQKSGFTLVELLVVISIIALLSSVVFASINSARAKARDARRAEDMRQIFIALNFFYDQNGCLPLTSGSACPGTGAYSEPNAGAWDYSSQGGFMQFLSNSGFLSRVPTDPVNNMTGDAAPSGSFAYRYYCYDSSNPNPGLSMGYFKESGGWGFVLFGGSAVPIKDFTCR